MTKKEKKMIEIFRAILIHMNGYSEAQLTDDVVLENMGHPLWEAIEDIL